MNPARILLIDDEQPILNMIDIVLRREGFQTIEMALTGTEGINKCATFNPDLIVLDVMLPDIEGFEVCRQFREFTQAPVLFLTARTSDLDKLMGFGMGGDDYITKPFNPLEVVARIKAHLKRLNPMKETNAQKKIFDFGRFKLDESSAELMVEREKIICPAREFQLLLFLCKHPNQVFSRSQLFEYVWGESSLGDDNTVMVHIRRLREKIEIQPGQPQYLITVRGLGYKLVRP